jgi:DNA-directed RNA polymerase specialized sigma24 family protein
MGIIVRLPFHFQSACGTLSATVTVPAELANQDLFESARSLRRPAVEELLRAHYPQVCRIAMGVCGREAAGLKAARRVMSQSLRMLPNWKNVTEAGNWFLHHTVLAAREAGSQNPVDAPDLHDCLVEHVDRPSTEYLAFIRALRNLQPQQAEAFLLSRGEKLEPRQIAVAMDCSTAAAANHLIAANKTLASIAVPTFDAQAAALARVYASLTPPERLIVGDISTVARRLSRRRLRGLIRNTITLLLLVAIAWIIWRLSRMIVI